MYAMSLCFLLFISCLLQQGCFLKYTWKDYLPLTTVELTSAPICISPVCRPRYEGQHVLSLQIEKVHRNPIPIKLSIRGDLDIRYGDGTSKVLSFAKTFNDEYWLPPTPYDLNVLRFTIDKHGELDDCKMSFRAIVEGDVKRLLKREPNCRLIIRFDDGSK